MIDLEVPRRFRSLVAQARARGHEALLQAPMEPFDYPQNNPGPHTLLTGAPDGGAEFTLEIPHS